jgi:putative addiction module component (TIGR02574 family)
MLELPRKGWPCKDPIMPSSPLPELLKLSAKDRTELAMALWESLTDSEREGSLQLADEEHAELDRRWTEHLEDPASGVPWSTVRSKLIG